MTWVSWSVSLTLVLLGTLPFATAAPTEEIDIFKKNPQKVEEKTSTSVDFEQKKLSITQPQTQAREQEDSTKSIYYSYKQSMAPRLGLVLDPDLISDNKEVPMLFGITYMFPRSHSPKVELGFDILTNTKAHISAVLRRVFFENESFRPYLTAGLTLQADADERFATFSDWENYHARASLGFEDVIEMPMSVRLELAIVVGSQSQMAILNFGYSWGW